MEELIDLNRAGAIAFSDGENAVSNPDSILKIFEKFQVKPIMALEHEFDPAVHQAVLQEASDEHAENTVIREFQKGYTIHDRLLRPAMVVVSKAM